MNKTTICFLIWIAAITSTTQVLSQIPNSTDMLSEALAKVEFINSLSSAHPKVESQKTTSKTRAITAKVWTYTFGQSSKIYADSNVYINQGGRYSELEYLNFNYFYFPENLRFQRPLRANNFAANTMMHYIDPGTGVYFLSDTSSYSYNANGDLINIFRWHYKDSFYYIDSYAYDASNRPIEYKWMKCDTNGTKLDSSFAYLRYGPNYVIYYSIGSAGDSIILDANGRVLNIYKSFNWVEEFTYDSNGYVATYKRTKAGILDFEYSLTFEPDYKQYSYHYISYPSNNSTRQKKRILLGHSGILDSAYFAWYDSTGAFLFNSEFTSVTTDSFGNITLTETHDAQGRFLESYRYYYEDVITGLSDIRTPFSDFKVYPNPGSRSDIMITTGENFSSVTVSSISGQKILHTSFRPRNEMRLDLSTLTAGSYLITVRSDDGRESSQVFTKM